MIEPRFKDSEPNPDWATARLERLAVDGYNDLSNLIVLCHKHHSWVETHRDAAYQVGLLRRSTS